MTSPDSQPESKSIGMPADETMKSSSTFSIMEAIQQLIAERKQVDGVAQESYERLNQLREAVRAEKAAAEAELQKRQQELQGPQAELEQLRKQVQGFQPQLDQLRHERDVAQSEMQALTARAQEEAGSFRNQLEQLRIERDIAADEAAQLRHQLDQQRNQAGDFETLLNKLQEEIALQQQQQLGNSEQLKQENAQLAEQLKSSQEQEQTLREQLREIGDLTEVVEQIERDRRHVEEKEQNLQQLNANLQQREELLQKERSALAEERLEIERFLEALPADQAMPMPAAAPSPQPLPSSARMIPTAPAPFTEQRMLTFPCKNCAKQVQAKERLAGLMTKCPHCGKMVPVPKASAR